MAQQLTFQNALGVGFLMVLAYLIGSIPFALLLGRWRVGIDVRDQGSGHAGATNLMRAAGFGYGGVAALLALGKGVLATRLAMSLGPEWAVPLAAGMAVTGHCWTFLARFRGGMGVATAAGALLAVWPLGLVLAVGLDAFLILILRHAARANVVSGLALAPLFLLFGGSRLSIGVALVVGLVIALRGRVDWNRQYRELWLDREGE